MKLFAALVFVLLPVSANAAQFCAIHPFGRGCEAYCRARPLDASCGGNAGQNFCTVNPFRKGCPNFCRVHRIDPVCR